MTKEKLLKLFYYLRLTNNASWEKSFYEGYMVIVFTTYPDSIVYYKKIKSNNLYYCKKTGTFFKPEKNLVLIKTGDN